MYICIKCKTQMEGEDISPMANFCYDCWSSHDNDTLREIRNNYTGQEYLEVEEDDKTKLEKISNRYYDNEGELMINGKTKLFQLTTEEDIRELKQAQKDIGEYVNSSEGLELIKKHLGKEWKKDMPNEFKLIEMRLRHIAQQSYIQIPPK